MRLGSVPVSAAVKAAVTLCCRPDFSKRQGTGNTPLSHYWVDSKVIELAGVFSSLPFPRCLRGLGSFVSRLCRAAVPGNLGHGSMC